MRELCLIHANCQGEPLARLLGAHPAFAERYDILHVVNYTRQAMPEEALAGCGLFLYQWLGEHWGELASDRLLARLPRGAASLSIPNLFYQGYWPLWMPANDFDYADRFLEDMLGRGLGGEETLRLYLQGRIEKLYDLQALVAESIEHERRKERRWDFPMVDLILERAGREQLFWTVNHPGRELCLHVAAKTLEQLGYEPLPAEAVAAFSEPFPEFELPIHPRHGELARLAFVGPERKYEVYGARKTFAEYVGCYLDCRLAGIEDFIGYLRLRCR
jgi:hypothetical protein